MQTETSPALLSKTTHHNVELSLIGKAFYRSQLGFQKDRLGDISTRTESNNNDWDTVMLEDTDNHEESGDEKCNLDLNYALDTPIDDMIIAQTALPIEQWLNDSPDVDSDTYSVDTEEPLLVDLDYSPSKLRETASILINLKIY